MTQHSAADGVPARWCLIALEQALVQNRERSGVTVRIFNGFYDVDVTGLPPTLPCAVASLLGQITADNSDAIGGQLFPDQCQWSSAVVIACYLSFVLRHLIRV